MDRIFSFGELPVGEQQWATVVVGEPERDQRHIGILHRDQNEGPQFLHLAWHRLLQNDAELPVDMVVWIKLNVPLARQRSVAAFCRRVWRKNGRRNIPYAFSRPDGSFDVATGEYLIGPSRYGLTCASFVLAIFHAVGIPLARYETWPVERPGDLEWQESIVKMLESKQIDQEHMNHLRGEIGTVRYRPEEVAACAAVAPPAATFEQVEQLGRQIVEEIREHS